MKNKIVVPTGYMGSGSSAITDVLYEIYGFDETNEIKRSFEYVFLHCPNGLFDLEDKLLYGNNILRSDEATHSFLDCMYSLYRQPHYWVGGYCKAISKDFYKLCQKFINELEVIMLDDSFWYYQEKPRDICMYIVDYFQEAKRRLSRRPIQIHPALSYRTMMVAYPDNTLFYQKARSLLLEVFARLGFDRHTIILDQLLLPHNLHRINNYFDDELRVIVVERDPRDVYFLNKYVWSKTGGVIPYPFDVKKYCAMYRALRRSEKIYDDSRILRMHFEDLIYNYERTYHSICDFLNIPEGSSIHKGKYFDPEVSRNNTQVFRVNKSFASECAYIEAKLKDYLYDFPIKTISQSLDQVF